MDKPIKTPRIAKETKLQNKSLVGIFLKSISLSSCLNNLDAKTALQYIAVPRETTNPA
jgi:hypothetical protein